MAFLDRLALSGPLFALVLLGAVVARWTGWQPLWTAWLNKLVFAVLLPVLLFRTVSKGHGEMQADPRLLIAFFGSCLLVFWVGFALSKRLVSSNGADAALVGVASVFSNNGLLGIPLVQVMLGEQAMPAVAWIMTFNAVTLWTLVTVVVETAADGRVDWRNFGSTLGRVALSPIIVAVVCGIGVALTDIPIAEPIGLGLDVSSRAAGPLALLALGLDMARFDVRRGVGAAAIICALKLVVQPLCAWGLCVGIGLARLDSQVVVLMSSLSVGVNAYLMAQRFERQQSAVASAPVLSTLLSSLTTPALLSMTLG